MTLVAGVDCSTQATKVVVCDAASGEVLREGRAAHPDLTEVHPSLWWEAITDASSGLLDDVAAMAVGGQQHGMVLVDQDGQVVRDALLWNDNRSAPQAEDLVTELGGPAAWSAATGLVPVASFTITKLRWVAEHDIDAAGRASGVLLPHDWITHRLRVDDGAPTTDRGDASGTGYWSAAREEYRPDLLELAFGRELDVPQVAGPREVVGETATGIAVAAGTGDNMAAALGLDLRSGDVAVSLGTSGTVFTIADSPTDDPSGIVAGFADATGRYLPLVCTLNAARVPESVLRMVGVGIEDLDRLALSVDDADGLVLLPFLDGERTPPLPQASGLLHGLTRRNSTPAHLARAAVEGMLSGLSDAVDALRSFDVTPRRVVLVGGAARSLAVQRIAAGLLDLPVAVPQPAEYVALGAARQAAWALAGSERPPSWDLARRTVEPDPGAAAGFRRTRDSYRAVLEATTALLRDPPTAGEPR